VNLLVTDRGVMLGIYVTPGQQHESTAFQPLMRRVLLPRRRGVPYWPAKLAGDKGSSSCAAFGPASPASLGTSSGLSCAEDGSRVLGWRSRLTGFGGPGCCRSALRIQDPPESQSSPNPHERGRAEGCVQPGS
jgi:hypothetical protein